MNALAVRWNDWPITRKSLAVVTLQLLAVALMATCCNAKVSSK
ncbi:hypothetical protein XocBur1_16460 [Xanthomonas oryzae pv. oryzicola]|nr:hypothetical protein [Xanthomonas oryzae pv. oryzicola]MEC5114872.1 hypothetical protein [Xanthomonas oryzae pv. oryzicola]